MLISIEKGGKASVTRFNKKEGGLPPLMVISIEKCRANVLVTRFNKKKVDLQPLIIISIEKEGKQVLVTRFS